ncbi:MAG TPA: DUF3089 domain-containing protein [Acidimicrobiales bacterium]|nr:DUF3089 domain-containing protein [Acidimicrobiales bacterium]
MRCAGMSWVRVALVTGLVVLVAACSGDDDGGEGSGERDAAPAEEVVDPYHGHTSEVYGGTTNWLCHPDLEEDECTDLSATEVAPDGTVSRADLVASDDPPVDCFYVYPTVSLDATPNSDLEPDEQERSTVGSQAAPFATTCRVFAPVYPQVTLGQIGGGGFADAGPIAYAGALDAWQTYVSQYNEGRGVILIGHSQGTGILNQLIAEEIDTNPDLRSRLVSAVLLGGAVRVPDGELVGGSFQNVPGCTSADETGCVIGFSSYPTASPPEDGAIFGQVGGGPTPEQGAPTDRALCVDPVALAGGNGLADSIVPVAGPLIGGGDLSAAGDFDTRYVVLPEVLKASCETQGVYTFFSAAPASAADPRAVTVEGLLAESLGDAWGLHLQDAQLAMGDLLEVAARQAEAFTSGSASD